LRQGYLVKRPLIGIRGEDANHAAGGGVPVSMDGVGFGGVRGESSVIAIVKEPRLRTRAQNRRAEPIGGDSGLRRLP
jgi:hypothetical protein